MIDNDAVRRVGATEDPAPSKRDARGVAWILGGESARVVSAGLMFLVLARALTPAGFGTAAGVLGLSAAFVPFTTFGYGNLLVRDVAQGSIDVDAAWRRGLAAWSVGSVSLVLTFVICSTVFLPSVPITVVLALGVAEVAGIPLIDLAAQAHVARHDMRRAAVTRSSVFILRTACALAFVLAGASGIEVWAPVYLGATFVAAIGAVTSVLRRYGCAFRPSPLSAVNLRDGLPFSFSLASSEVQADIDKTVLVRYGLVAEAGVYAVAYRMMGFAALPVRAVMTTMYPRFFQEGARSASAALALARRVLPVAVLYCLVAGVLLVGAARIVPLVVGEDYAAVRWILPALACVPILRAVQMVMADVLTGAGCQPLRMRIQMSLALMNLSANIVLIGRFQVRGAIAATIATELVGAVVIALASLRLGRTNA